MNTNLSPLFIREQVIKAVRSFFDEQGFHEVIIPVLSTAIPLEPNIEPFLTTWNRNGVSTDLYLTTSPERYLKFMLAAGVENCYAISPAFRNLEGMGGLHRPEFLMLEWYRKSADYTTIMRDTKELIQFVAKKIKSSEPHANSNLLEYQGNHADIKNGWQTKALGDLFAKHTGITIYEAVDDAPLFAYAKKNGYNVKNATWEQLFDQIFVNEIEPQIGPNPTFVTDFPCRLSPLCTPKKSDPLLAQRFEFFLFGRELGNGNTENTDADSVEAVFKSISLKNPTRLIDTAFLKALRDMNNASFAGIGLGVERLAMIFSNTADINTLVLPDVI